MIIATLTLMYYFGFVFIVMLAVFAGGYLIYKWYKLGKPITPT